MGLRGQTQRAPINVRALIAIALIVVTGAAVTATGAFDPASQTPPSQFDYDGGSMSPTADDRAIATVQAVALIGTLPAAAIALVIATSSLRLWKEQVSAIIATSLASLSALASVFFVWVGVGTLVFFT
ncbi:hypothetical protein [Curtobacterium sp. MCSS17_005]|uniref:hypothetical protein n=1 Tax=Curtobacterium sp. MCSS17_005 TaxID=2175641 RepID=UPI000DA7E332|nr:hypothetical protein [Curtobacterium sp. MCSS17_005]WIB34429.1 hypothetical protein DEJ20_08165 [Curtobacterium sp. MCSS17_005]